MTEHIEDPHLPGVYEKGDSQRVANSRSAAVALVFEGYKRVTEPEAEAEEAAPAAPRPTPPAKPKEDPKP